MVWSKFGNSLANVLTKIHTAPNEPAAHVLHANHIRRASEPPASVTVQRSYALPNDTNHLSYMVRSTQAEHLRNQLDRRPCGDRTEPQARPISRVDIPACHAGLRRFIGPLTAPARRCEL